MASFCQVTLVGNATKDPIQSGKVVRLSVAVNSGFGERKVTSYYDVACFGRTGENVLKYVKKGLSVGVSGRLEHRKYTNKAGQPGASLDVVASDVTFLSPKAENGVREEGGEPMGDEVGPQGEAEAF